MPDSSKARRKEYNDFVQSWDEMVKGHEASLDMARQVKKAFLDSEKEEIRHLRQHIRILARLGPLSTAYRAHRQYTTSIRRELLSMTKEINNRTRGPEGPEEWAHEELYGLRYYTLCHQFLDATTIQLAMDKKGRTLKKELNELQIKLDSVAGTTDAADKAALEAYDEVNDYTAKMIDFLTKMTRWIYEDAVEETSSKTRKAKSSWVGDNVPNFERWMALIGERIMYSSALLSERPDTGTGTDNSQQEYMGIIRQYSRDLGIAITDEKIEKALHEKPRKVADMTPMEIHHRAQQVATVYMTYDASSFFEAVEKMGGIWKLDAMRQAMVERVDKVYAKLDKMRKKCHMMGEKCSCCLEDAET